MFGYGSSKHLNTDPIRIRIHNTGYVKIPYRARSRVWPAPPDPLAGRAPSHTGPGTEPGNLPNPSSGYWFLISADKQNGQASQTTKRLTLVLYSNSKKAPEGPKR